ncbi:MAG: polyisoprenoid-binding protein [Planctomycetes bacterium]|nr:polyisoprenoid-binding protein [Planctomycetota bacterium]
MSKLSQDVLSRSTRVWIMLLSAAVILGCGSQSFADAYKIDGMHSSVMFRVKHLNVSPFYGRFNSVSGKIQVNDDPTKSTFEVIVKTESLDTNDKKRDGHIKGTDFFNVREFPTITFKSKSIKTGDKGVLKVTGDLTCHGVTKSITVDMTATGSGPDPWGGFRTGFETTFTIKRSDYGMDYMLKMLGDDVKLFVALEGVKQ